MASVQLFRPYLKPPFFFLLIFEFCIVFSTVYSARFLRFYADGLDLSPAVQDIFGSALVVSLITVLSMLSMGLYVGNLREGMAGILIRVALSLLMASLLTAMVFYLFPDLSLWRGVVAIAFILAFFVIGTVRAIFFEFVDTSVFKSRVLVYGAGKEASFIDTKLRRKSDRRGFDITGYVLLEDQKLVVDDGELVNIEGKLIDFVNGNEIDEIVVASNDARLGDKVHELVECKLNGTNVLDLLTFFEREAGQIRIDILPPTWLVTTDGFRQSTFQNVIKRVFDIVVSLFMLIITIPVQLVIIAAIWAEDGIGAPIIYRQLRAGAHGKCFNVYKYRSMVSDAEKAGEAVWAGKGDSRITRTGAFLRKYRLDELPQTVNVIRGDMSFVGPRPERPEFVAELADKIPYYNERHVLKPGLTGWAQLNYPYGSSLDDAYHKQIYDMYYVKNHSLFLDCLILLQTVEVILFGKGAR